jgi:hypothetical protein
MGQYHKVVNPDAAEWIDSHELGAGLKAWEAASGCVPGALAALIAHRPGNMPADLGHHALVGHWAGQRVLVVGDYAERGDIKRFKGPPLNQLYSLCMDAREPEIGDFREISYWRHTTDKRTGRTRDRLLVETAALQYKKALAEYRRMTRRHAPLANIAPSIRGLLESTLSMRIVGEGWQTVVPVEAYAKPGDAPGTATYVLPASIDARDRDFYFRCLGIPQGTPYPDTLPGGRWPWDRAPGDGCQHNMTDALADEGQHRVFINLDMRQYFDPAALGEQPTLAGIMRASSFVGTPRMAMDMVISSGGIETDVQAGDNGGVGSASALYAMLLHPERRGGGDIDPAQFPLIGAWRNHRLVLTSEYGTEYPTTEEAKASFDDITDDVRQSLELLRRND